MDRLKAVALLREILEVSKHTNIRAITLNRDDKGNLSLKLDCDLTDEIKKSIQPILERDKLTIKQEDGFLIIYSANG